MGPHCGEHKSGNVFYFARTRGCAWSSFIAHSEAILVGRLLPRVGCGIGSCWLWLSRWWHFVRNLTWQLVGARGAGRILSWRFGRMSRRRWGNVRGLDRHLHRNLAVLADIRPCTRRRGHFYVADDRAGHVSLHSFRSDNGLVMAVFLKDGRLADRTGRNLRFGAWHPTSISCPSGSNTKALSKFGRWSMIQKSGNRFSLATNAQRVRAEIML